MLDLFRRKQSGLKWILWIVILALTGGMMLLFVGTPSGVTGGLGSRNVASVAGKSISSLELRRAYTRLYEVYRKAYKLDQQDSSIVKQLGLGKQALNQLIRDYAIRYEADKMGIQATPEETAQHISNFPVFQKDGEFIGVTRYQEILKANGMTPLEFEEDVSREIVREKFQRIVTDGVFATPEEVRREFLNRTQQVQVTYVAIGGAGMMLAEVDDAKVRGYFDKNKEKYKVPEQRKLKYVSLAVRPDEVEVSEERINARMSELPVPEQEQVRASHILVGVSPGEDETRARKEAEKLLRGVRSGADFAEMARRYSQDDNSAVRGGDLGFFGRGQMLPEFEQVVFSLNPGEISDLVRTSFGFHIIKVTDAPRTNEAARKALAEFRLHQEEAEKSAASLASQISQQAKNSNLEDIARQYDLQVQQTPLFALSDQIPGLNAQNDFNQAVFSLNKGEVTEPYQGAAVYIVAELVDIQAAEMPTLEQIRDKVVEDFQADRREELARERAFDFHKQVKGNARFKEVARAQGIGITTTEFFNKGTTIDDTLKFSPEVHDRAFRMNKGEVSPPVKVAGKYIVFRVVDKTEIDEQNFEQEREQLGEELSQKKRSSFFAIYVQNSVEELQRNDQISINLDLLEAVTG